LGDTIVAEFSFPGMGQKGHGVFIPERPRALPRKN
jgi:hypothetical protein